MANIKISELNSLSKKASNDVLPIVDVSADETKKIKIEDLLDKNVSLIAVSDTAPTECFTGDKYFNTTTNLIYTAVDTDTWSETGEEPIEGIFYVVFNEQSSYAYNGTTLVSVGGGTEDIIISDEQPTTDDWKIWIDSGETENLGSEIESGSNINGNWIKFADGTMICYRNIITTIDCNNSWGNLYYGVDNTAYNFAQEFIDAPTVFTDIRANANSGVIKGDYKKPTITTTSIQELYILRPTSSTNVSVSINILAIGRWQ